MPFERWGRISLAVCQVVCCATLSSYVTLGFAADAPPRVLGFERMHAADAGDAVAGGQLLLGELNCTSCHQAEASLAAVIRRKPAPILDSVGSRVRPQYLLKFLADPQATKPGTTMPNVLAGLAEGERTAVVESLVHFLATTGNAMHAKPSRRAVTRGETLFGSVGCLACHDPRTEPRPTLATSIPLGTPSRKYTLPGMTQFLQDPLAVRPGGRMPHLNLSPAEARDVASFLLNDLDIVSGLQYAYYEGQWEQLPDFSKLAPAAIGDAENFDLGLAARRDHFALRFEGTINLPKAGDYLFLIGSDDGSRLLIDDKVAVVNDGIHSYEQKRKKLKMAAGPHTIVVEYFEAAGEESLQVDFEGPGMQQQPLATLLSAPAIEKGTAPGGEPFVVDPLKAAQGREHFGALGCAACHVLHVGASPVVATNKAKGLSQLAAGTGCLAPNSAATPKYGLAEHQTAAISAALAGLKAGSSPMSPQQLVQRNLVRFNCVACHERDQLGGVEESRNAYFQSDMPEMGDEGRLPPSLAGVGAKLTAKWLRTLFEQGADDRPYMLTRMPKFGLVNVGELVDALAHADEARIKPAPALTIASDDERRVKAAGRRLVGAQGFSCIKCHTFAGQRSSGIQAISLTTLTERLRPEWFHHYLQNPLGYRPGTRMPTPFPDGQTTLPGVFDGTVHGQIGAIWSYLSDGNNATFPVGLVTGKIELIAFDEPVIYRNFIEGAGTRAIGVGYPEKLNLAFDAENLSLALLWHGGFIDAARHWTARGQGFEKPLGDNVLKLPAAAPLARLTDSQAAWPAESAKALGFRFAGYRLNEKKQPTFLYSWNDVQVEDQPRPVGEQDLYALQRSMKISTVRPQSDLWLRAARAQSIRPVSGGTYKIDDRWLLRVQAAGSPLLRQLGDEWELLVPVLLADGSASVELTYDW